MTVLATKLEKPIPDNREYRDIQLANGLEVLLIHDPQADKASAALDVHVGSFADPEQVPGLAHFLEHLLFMGTEKYPSENEYSQYLTAHAGSYNAYTSAEHTNYYFDIAHQNLHGALDRFSQFFVCPLFSKSCQDREILAVDSENKKNLQYDTWRLYQLEKSLGNPKHPFHKFSTGNYETLHTIPKQENIDVRQLLLDFHENHYSSNIMKLVILGRESLDQLQEWAEQLFSQVKNQNFTNPVYEETPLTGAELGTVIKALPVMDSQHLELSFPVPDQQPYYQTQPSHYYSHLIGHESAGSLLHLLKARSWANALSCGSTHVCTGSDIFVVDIELTRQGAEHWQDVLALTFDYIRLVREAGPQEWVFDELQAMSKAAFLYKQKTKPSSTTSALARTMHRKEVPRDKLLSFSVLETFDKHALNEFSHLLTPDNVRVLFTSQTLTNLDEAEHWYGTKYRVDSLKDLFASFNSRPVNTDLHLPVHNEFVPNDFKLVQDPHDNKALRPELVTNTEGLKVWHKLDDTYGIPKTHLELKLSNSECRDSVRSSMLTELYVQLVMDALTDYAYYAEVAGLSYAITSGQNGVEVVIYGFSEKLDKLAAVVAKALAHTAVDAKRFSAIKERITRQLENSLYAMPYNQLGLHGNPFVAARVYPVDEKLKALKDINASDLAPFVSRITAKWNAEMLVVGNVSPASAVALGSTVQQALESTPIEREQVGTFWLPRPSAYYFKYDLPDKNNTNSAIEYRLQVGELTNMEQRAALLILAQIIKEPVFDQLRTKEQLGYVVGSYVRPIRSTTWLRVFAQTEAPTWYVEQRIDALLLSIDKLLVDMSDAEYEKNVAAVALHHLEKFKNLSEETTYFWNSISNGFYDFDRKTVIAATARATSKQQVLDLYRQYISPRSQQRAKFVVHLKAQKAAAPPLHVRLGQAIEQVARTRELVLGDTAKQAAAACQESGEPEALQVLAAELDKLGVADAAEVCDEVAQAATKAVAAEYVGEAVTDAASFQAGLEPVPLPKPLVDLKTYEPAAAQ